MEQENMWSLEKNIDVLKYALAFSVELKETDLNDLRFQNIISVLKKACVGDRAYIIDLESEFKTSHIPKMGYIIHKDDNGFTIESDDKKLFDFTFEQLNINNSKVLVISKQ